MIDWSHVFTVPDQNRKLFDLLNYGQSVSSTHAAISLGSWTPPIWLKTNNWYCAGSLNVNYNGGQGYGELSENWRIMLEIFKGDPHPPSQDQHPRVDINYISIQNEPNFLNCEYVPSWESASWDVDTYLTAVGRVKHNLTQWGFGSDNLRFIGPEFNNPQGSILYFPGFLTDVINNENVSTFATHNYNNCNYADPERNRLFYIDLYNRAHAQSKPTWQSEFGGCFPGAPCYDDQWWGQLIDAELEAQHIMVALRDLKAGSYQTFWLARDWNGSGTVRGDAWVTINTATNDLAIENKKYWYAKHFTAFIEPGMVRVDMSPSQPLGTIYQTVFESQPNAQTGTGVAVFLNRTDTDFAYSLGWPGMTQLDVWQSSSASNDTCRQTITGLLPDGNQRFPISIPAHGMITVRGYYSRSLPIQLWYFTGTYLPSSNAVRLDWATLSETNNYGFYLEKTKTPPNYTLIPNSFVPGHGTTLQPQYFQFTDQSVTPGLWYYRLKQIDLNGTVSYPATTTVQVVTGIGVGDITSEAMAFASVPADTIGEGHDIAAIHDGIEPPVGSRNQRWHFTTRGRSNHDYDWIGYEFSTPKTFSSIKLQSGVHLGSAGSFRTVSVQIDSSGQWKDVRNVQISPEYPERGRTTDYRVCYLTFPPTSGRRIRLHGRSHGFISVGEMRVYGYRGLAKPSDDLRPLPDKPFLADNYPDPFNPVTQIVYALPASRPSGPKATRVRLEVFDLLGRSVRTLLDEEVAEGFHTATWNGVNAQGNQVGAGTYFYRMSVGDFVLTKNMLLLK